ncbi:MAG: TlpA family protein disulfide reductase [Burkholderiales bacterium]
MNKWLLVILLFLSVSAMAAEDWSLMDTEGKVIRLSDFKGKWVLVNFWATWCPPCLAEIPDLIGMRRKGTDVAVVGIAVSYRNPEEVLDFARKKGITYPIVLGNEDIASKFGGIDSLPTSFLYSPEGKLVGQHEGPLTQNEIRDFIHGTPLH